MKFKLTANCTLEAKDIDGAFWAVAKHFQTLAGDGVYDMIETGFVKLEPIQEGEPPPLGINVMDGVGAKDIFGKK